MNNKPLVSIPIETISIEKIQHDAEQYHQNGFFCCEAVVASIYDNFKLDLPREVIGMSSAMAGGIGCSGCVCGALNGAVLVMGMFFGRTEPNGPTDPQATYCLSLTKELYHWFREETQKNSVCCRILTRGFDMAKGEHKEQCVRFTGLCARKAAELIVRELSLKNIDIGGKE